VHESTCAESVLALAIAYRVGKRDEVYTPKKVAGDKAYSVKRIREWLADMGIKAVIPQKENERVTEKQRFDGEAYRGRCVVEQCVGWLKDCRRIGTRFEKLAVHFLGMLHLAIIRRYLRLLFSDRA
jgi:transposase